MREQNPLNALQPPMRIGVCYAVVVFCLSVVLISAVERFFASQTTFWLFVKPHFPVEMRKTYRSTFSVSYIAVW
jgi:hypothetical protein